ncbi:histidinol-phosphate aminotransferase [Acetonema longum DSM 6540]|uniref:Histidinol-phosphate aminotransferase n=1 Tax=Acetonema longum DSM 6540 TaxID=1009370 RepID=F7NEN9_9FIRM|nr:histidinol-phosphate transaminase [Acetonema longum]EGO65450.1 histidinol-phosphate aminotransferase [Acetonema longum DSM 6540]
MKKIRENISQLKPYSTAETQWRVRLDANERPENLPSAVKEQVLNRLAGLDFNRYPDSGATELRQKIGAAFGLDGGNVLLGNGSSELLAVICTVFGGEGRKIIYPTPSFSMYSVYAKLSDSPAFAIPLEADFSPNMEKVIGAAQSEQAGLVILCNPNNPTGNVMQSTDIRTVLAAATCPVVVDEAYYEYCGQSVSDLLPQFPNLIITRTFSKAYGLAGVRAGYMLAAADIVAAVIKAQLPYHMNALSLAAATAVWETRQAFAADIALTIAERERMTDSLGHLSTVQVYPSKTNFLLIRVEQPAALREMFAAQSVGIRDFSDYQGLEGCFRITVGTRIENNLAMNILERYHKTREPSGGAGFPKGDSYGETR